MKKLISIVVPAYNEELVLPIFHSRIDSIIKPIEKYDWEIVFVNDGSRDSTQNIIDNIQSCDQRISSVNLSRNFGKEIAMTAGLEHARGDAIIVIDADLQDPPELIVDFISAWENGFDIAYARRTHRDGETWLKKYTAAQFYKLMGKISNIHIPADTGDYRIMSRRTVDAILQLREHHRFMKGIFSWVGYPSKAIDYRREARAAGETKFNYWKLWNFAIEGITSFTILPLKIATYLGVLVSLLAFCAGIWTVLKTIAWGEPVAGYPTLIVTMLFLGGIQLLFIGILGEYIGRIFNETKNRPLYFVQSYTPANIIKKLSEIDKR
ncbi:glycosyltransferase family 2 protein [Acidovorax sp. 106]|uniref:glycosyltransferase family 2 protein n=1 Tax=Acidovorax sp. 106 TaxID=2135637 RepID=UPI000EB180D1|nr:glycosyltransferase family 2 protein [Acidovorax sp. 106]RLJ37139.1 glycosyltransferase involved in cell wall biosynthesis [Acidovorax sp. 106]